jgi:putative lipoprotein
VEFVVRLEGDSAWVFAPGETLRLAQLSAASGARYGSGAATLWMKGQKAMLRHGGRIYTDCRNDPARAVWEHAKLSGADFRAVGNEPGWSLEIRRKTDILLVTDYGQNRYHFEAQAPSSNPGAMRTTYTAQGPEHRIEVVIQAQPCHDTMSGEAFPSTVTVWLDGREYRGCGRPLH